MSSFQDAKQTVKASIQNEVEECSMHAMWIRGKLGAIDAIKTEADLATEQDIATSQSFNAHVTVSNEIRKLMKKDS